MELTTDRKKGESLLSLANLILNNSIQIRYLPAAHQLNIFSLKHGLRVVPKLDDVMDQTQNSESNVDTDIEVNSSCTAQTVTIGFLRAVPRWSNIMFYDRRKVKRRK